ncbi:Uncharacterized membrane protein YdjX, TVP38/TMEM64 family, SNARE-associated domain [Halobiforma haloterrestris]|uniref:Uncharacterized membrane protein YdjX, TVP38/TMEM64 family, SNARE-associated domain n=1 Tax=Natronobacterium haloterrestre TaxID=148448 RepID=A0A1I1LTB5_NATHA|nr:VTT domain-containing protein [Halobiforma haloterrestris]SFC73543.1 Uncharacterized membrane protein YdjX, TVP38/TMEM64 family, SNARE-associated domain [Halobiforma haloterrestris]
MSPSLPSPSALRSSSGSIRTLLGALTVGALVLAGLAVSPGDVLGGLESLAADPYRFGIVVGGLYLVRPALAWPTTPLAVVVGYGYGIAVGVPIALLGVVVTVLPVFLAVRRFRSGEANEADSRSECTDGDRSKPLLERAGAVADRYYGATGQFRGVTASRLAPIPSDIATAAAAASGVRIRHFVAGTVAGELPWTVAAVVVGASAATVTTDGLGDLGLALSVACGLGAVLLLAGPAYRALRGRFAVESAESRSSRPSQSD